MSAESLGPPCLGCVESEETWHTCPPKLAEYLRGLAEGCVTRRPEVARLLRQGADALMEGDEGWAL